MEITSQIGIMFLMCFQLQQSCIMYGHLFVYIAGLFCDAACVEGCGSMQFGEGFQPESVTIDVYDYEHRKL